jgi:hypothetical protein
MNQRQKSLLVSASYAAVLIVTIMLMAHGARAQKCVNYNDPGLAEFYWNSIARTSGFEQQSQYINVVVETGNSTMDKRTVRLTGYVTSPGQAKELGEILFSLGCWTTLDKSKLYPSQQAAQQGGILKPPAPGACADGYEPCGGLCVLQGQCAITSSDFDVKCRTRCTKVPIRRSNKKNAKH